MTGGTPCSADSEIARLEAAADWLQTLSSTPLEDATLESWLEWYGRDPANQKAFDGIVEVWGAMAHVPPAVRAALRSPAVGARGAPVSSARQSRTPLWAALAASLVVACTTLVWLGLRDPTVDHGEVLASPLGVNSTSQLPDGSVVELGGRTSARLSYTAAERRVEVLDGEVYLTVAKDAGRPFVVDAGALRVTAVGTAFNVRRSGSDVVVTVGEGAVEVVRSGSAARGCEPAGGCVHLTAGRQLRYREGAKALVVRSVDPAVTTSWRNGVLKFVDEPLSAVVSSVNRYSHRPIQIRDAALGALSFTGTVHVERIDNWLNALGSAFPLRVVEAGEEGVLLVSRK